MNDIFEEIFENSPVALILVNPDGMVHLMNSAAEQLFGYDRSELINRPIEVLVPRKTVGHHPKLVQDYVKNPKPRLMGRGRELFGIKKGGQEFPLEVGLSPIKTEDGLFVMSSIIDITDRIRAEEKFRDAFAAAPNGMLMVDSKGMIVLVNRQIEEMFLYHRKDLIGQQIEMLVPDALRAHHPKFVESYVANPEPRAMGVGRELYGQRKDKSMLPVEVGIRPVVTEDGVLVISSVVDITERVKTQAELQEKHEELEQFAYRTSHDLRSPLQTISGLCEFIRDDIKEGQLDEASENAEKIISLTAKLRDLIGDILALTKAEKMEEALSEFDFDRFLSDTREKLAHDIEEADVVVSGVFRHEDPLLIQTTRLQQVLENLISNGIKYAHSERDSRFVVITTHQNETHFCISVRDNGLGIPESRHDQVFGMFQRFHKSEKLGSGLGLYLVKKHITKLNASIDFESSPDGTEFLIKLPYS
ncbi:MAG: PAS domain S-box protein [Planctomycetota bacterium]